ncbi:caspase family protein [uncultured Hydrogenophaga sp.]|uniref:caspase family protein n=1 Tax=uncultured Hydrogenophaga sp. TaxID=199683 RepID=UPI002588C172|nr:caspase family protein [uncultured Hydrogenophaga sp.]
MTTIYESQVAPEVGTHVLIVGIGAYTHLRGGKKPAQETYGLGQLTSPPVSAKAMLDWFLAPLKDPAAEHGFRNSTAPLASVEALIAASDPVVVAAPAGLQAARDVELSDATLDDVTLAFENWRARLIASPGSTGIFYFCGHGVSTDTQYLLCQDTLKNAGRPFEKLFSLDSTLLHLGKDADGCHLHFWIDACREGQGDMLLSKSTPDGLRSGSIDRPTVEKSHSVLQATGQGEAAFGKKHDVSRFTSALLKALSGFSGSKKYGGPWQVDSTELAAAIKEMLRVESEVQGKAQYSTAKESGIGAAIAHLKGPSKVDLHLDLHPGDLRHQGEILVQSHDGATNVVHPCGDGAYTNVVTRGIYHLRARSTAGAFNESALENEFVEPPLYTYTFKVAP